MCPVSWWKNTAMYVNALSIAQEIGKVKVTKDSSTFLILTKVFNHFEVQNYNFSNFFAAM